MILLSILLWGLLCGWLANLILGGGSRPQDWGPLMIAGFSGSLVGGLLINLITGKFKSVQSLKLETINFIRRRDGRDGRGTLSIGYGVEKDSDGDPRPLTTEWPGVPDVKRVEALIREHAKWAR